MPVYTPTHTIGKLLCTQSTSLRAATTTARVQVLMCARPQKCAAAEMLHSLSMLQREDLHQLLANVACQS